MSCISCGAVERETETPSPRQRRRPRRLTTGRGRPHAGTRRDLPTIQPFGTRMSKMPPGEIFQNKAIKRETKRRVPCVSREDKKRDSKKWQWIIPGPLVVKPCPRAHIGDSGKTGKIPHAQSIHPQIVFPDFYAHHTLLDAGLSNS